MTVFRLSVICIGLLLTACQSEPARTGESVADAAGWQPSVLSEQTIARANDAVKQYERCLNTEAMQHLRERDDPRALADRILQTCETRLEGIRGAYDGEGVPPAITERYIRKTRSRGAQSLMRFVEAVYAQRAAEEAGGAAR